jgi:hypothetical protein
VHSPSSNFPTSWSVLCLYFWSELGQPPNSIPMKWFVSPWYPYTPIWICFPYLWWYEFLLLNKILSMGPLQ